MSKNELQRASESAMSKLRTGPWPDNDEMTALTMRFPFFLQCVLGQGDPDLPTDVGVLKSKMDVAERMIKEIEKGMQALRERMINVCPAATASMLSPFNIMERNMRNNPLRNKYECRLAAVEGRLSQHPISENAFFYMLSGEQRQKSAASFREGDRTVFGSENISQNCSLDALIIGHEMGHVTQDDAARSAITDIAGARQYQEKLKFLSERKRVVINGECGPYTTELQIADTILQGALQKPEKLSEENLFQRLGAVREDQKIIVATLVRLAKVFPGFIYHQYGQSYPATFGTELIDMHRREGYEVFYQNPSTGMLNQL